MQAGELVRFGEVGEVGEVFGEIADDCFAPLTPSMDRAEPPRR